MKVTVTYTTFTAFLQQSVMGVVFESNIAINLVPPIAKDNPEQTGGSPTDIHLDTLDDHCPDHNGHISAVCEFDLRELHHKDPSLADDLINKGLQIKFLLTLIIYSRQCIGEQCNKLGGLLAITKGSA